MTESAARVAGLLATAEAATATATVAATAVATTTVSALATLATLAIGGAVAGDVTNLAALEEEKGSVRDRGTCSKCLIQAHLVALLGATAAATTTTTGTTGRAVARDVAGLAAAIAGLGGAVITGTLRAVTA